MGEPEDIVDISGMQHQRMPRHLQQPPQADKVRPWLAMKWKCCGAYSRIYRNRAGSAYEGRCPKCAKHVRVPIGPGGTSQRFFEAE